jgi:hypothetical protein
MMMAAGFPNKPQSAFLVSAIVWAAVALTSTSPSCQAFLVVPTTSRAKTVAARMVMDNPHFIDPNRIDIILTDLTSEDLRKELDSMIEDKKCFTLMDDGPDVEILATAKGMMLGSYHRLLVARPVTVLSKTMMVPFLIDTASPYTYLSRDAIDRYGAKLPPGDFMADINGVGIATAVSPPNSHFSDFCLLGADYLFLSSSKLTCLYGSDVILLEQDKGEVESPLLRKTNREGQMNA